MFKMTYVERNFGSNDTIEAVIKNANKDENITGGLLTLLMKEYNNADKPRKGIT
jgi:hypothetical protein